MCREVSAVMAAIHAVMLMDIVLGAARRVRDDELDDDIDPAGSRMPRALEQSVESSLKPGATTTAATSIWRPRFGCATSKRMRMAGRAGRRRPAARLRAVWVAHAETDVVL
jgi:hypothetical protein